jgi:hypothetical protein
MLLIHIRFVERLMQKVFFAQRHSNTCTEGHLAAGGVVTIVRATYGLK